MQRSTTTAAPDVFRRNIFEAALHNDHEAVRLFVEGVPVTSVNSDKQTAAHIAAKNGNFPVLKYLLGKDRSLLHMKDVWDQTVLHLAVEKGSVELVKFLVDDCKANMYEPCEQRYNNTPIHMAAHEGNLEVLKYFIEDKKADKNVKNEYGEPPAFLAAEKNQVAILRYLFAQKANLTMLDVNNMNILFVSATSGDVSVPRFLLEEARIKLDLSWKDNFGDAILHRAAWNDRVDFVKYMVKKHHPDLNVIDVYDRTPLHIAAMKGNLVLVRFLVGHGTDTTLEDCWNKRAADSSSNYDVINYLFSVQGYEFTVDDGIVRVKPSRNVSQDGWGGVITHTISPTTEDPKYRTLAARRRPGMVRVRRSPSMSVVPHVRRGFSDERITQRSPTSHSANRVSRIQELGQITEVEAPSRFNNFLVFADACLRYFVGRSRNRRSVRNPSLLAPHEILRNRMNPIAVDAVKSFSK